MRVHCTNITKIKKIIREYPTNLITRWKGQNPGRNGKLWGCGEKNVKKLRSSCMKLKPKWGTTLYRLIWL